MCAVELLLPSMVRNYIEGVRFTPPEQTLQLIQTRMRQVWERSMYTLSSTRITGSRRAFLLWMILHIFCDAAMSFPTAHSRTLRDSAVFALYAVIGCLSACTAKRLNVTEDDSSLGHIILPGKAPLLRYALVLQVYIRGCIYVSQSFCCSDR